MIRHLAQRHRVTVASLVRSDEEASEGEGLRDYSEEILVGRVSEPWQILRMTTRLPTRTPSSMGYFFSPELRREIRKASARNGFDLVFVYCSSMAPYVSDFSGMPKILDFGDMDSQKWLTYSTVKPWPISMGYWIEGRKLETAERRLTKCFDLCTVTTKQELDTLRSFGAETDTDWFPNGVDAEYFKPDESVQYDPDLLSFVGRMDYYPNQKCMIDFTAKVLPQIRAQRPSTKLIIVGASPSRRIRKLSELPGVTVSGSVADVRNYVRNSAAMIAPLTIARGTQNKLLEAMAMGVPTITSELAAGGIDAVPGEHFLTASTDDEYIDAALSLLENTSRRAELAVSGRKRVLSHHDWRKSMLRMDEIIDRCVEHYWSARGMQRSAS